MEAEDNWDDLPTAADRLMGTYEYESDLELNADYIAVLDQALAAARDEYEYDAARRIIEAAVHEKTLKFAHTT